jgi:hypothetical protein
MTLTHEGQDDIPILKSEIPLNGDRQHSICFDTKKKTSITTTGNETG